MGAGRLASVWCGDIGSYDKQRLHSRARSWSVAVRAIRLQAARRIRKSGQSLHWATQYHVAPAADALPIQS
jgi:hypothetical protein